MITREALNNYAKNTSKQFSGRHLYVGASEVGQCLRKVGFVKHAIRHNQPVDISDNWGARTRGTTFEESFWVPAMRKHFGGNIKYIGEDQRRCTIGYLSGAADALLVNQSRKALAGLFVPDIGPSKEILLDCKTIDPRINLSEPKSEHVFQMHTNLGLLREIGSHKPDYGVIVYHNSSFWNDVVEFAVKFDPEIYKQAKIRAKQVIEAKGHLGRLPPEGWIAGGEECKYCPFIKECNAMRGTVPESDKTPSLQLVAELQDLAREEKKWAKASDEAATKQRAVQEEIKQRMREKGLRRIVHGTIKIIWSAVKGRPSFNLPALRAAATEVGLDVQRFETVGEPSDRLTITINKKGDNMA